jgi:hypothetical protein
MATGQIAILEGYQIPRYGKMPRKRKRRSGRMSGQKGKFAKAARSCSRSAKRSGRKGSFQACMKRLLKKGGRRRRRK